MKTVDVTIKGITSLLMHRFPLEPIEALEKKSREAQAELAAYRDPDTQGLYIPAKNVQRALISAATYSKGKGRGSLQRSASACLFISPERIPLGTKTYEIDTQPIVVPATRGRVLRHRPRLDSWKVSFQIEFDEDLLKETELRKIVDDMGSRVGLLDFRPEKKGSYGRSIVTEWHLRK